VLAIVVRHGRTAFNDPANPKMRAWEDVPLTDDGRADIQLTANKLKIYAPKMIYSSDLSRDSEGAFLMAEILGNIPYETDFALRTADMGSLGGKPEKEVVESVRRWYENPSMPAPNGETRTNFRRRFFAFFDPKIELAREVRAFRPTIFLTHGRIPAELDIDYNGALPEEAEIPMPGGYGVIRSNVNGMDSFELIGETEPILADV
jgi:broad specificity phosphatase PhoE